MDSQGEDVCKTITAGKLLRQRIEAGDFILAPGVYDGFSARIALEVGFDVLYMKHGYEEALERLRAARDAGADAAFPEGLRSVEEARRMIADLAPWPVLLNMVENSVTPKISAKEVKDLGFSMIIVPLATLAPAYTAIKAGLQKLKATGLADTELTPQNLFRVCGLDESMKIDEEAGASNFQGGVD
ncbi:hypothetical protein IL306_006300 [Fusarium sp. DS 682]|nr:hypothetical protein IL306_006300 [Fusarium sp. DS 682]